MKIGVALWLVVLSLVILQSCAKKDRYWMDGTLTVGLMANVYDRTNVQILKRRVEGVHCVDTDPEQRRKAPPDFRMAIEEALSQAPRSNVLVDASLSSFLTAERQVCWQVVGDAGLLL